MKEARDAIDDTLREGVDDHLSPATGGPRRKRSRQPEEILSDDSETSADEGYLEPTPLAVQDAAYADEADDDIEDLGFRIGRMRMGERIGGFYRPKIADEVRGRSYSNRLSPVANLCSRFWLLFKILPEDHPLQCRYR
jgi:hypothetical protein